MTHPEELLADLVAGRLSPRDRATVESHLASCDRCRHETDLARAGRDALVALEEVVPPASLGRTIEEAAGTRLVSAAAMRRRYRILAVAAAAALVALVAITLPHLGGPSATSEARSEAGAPAAANATPRVPKSLALETQQVDYDPTSIAALVRAGPPFSAATGGLEPHSGEGTASRSDAATALACLDRAFPGFSGTPTRLIRATFQGVPAYLGLYLEGPGPGLPADARSIRVASADTCTLLSTSRAPL